MFPVIGRTQYLATANLGVPFKSVNCVALHKIELDKALVRGLVGWLVSPGWLDGLDALQT